MLITLGNNTANRTPTTLASHTISFDAGTGGKLMVLKCRSENGFVISSPAYNSDAMTSGGSAIGGIYTFYLVNPDAGTNDLTLSVGSGGDRVYYTIEVWAGDVDTASPVGTLATASGSGGTKTISVTCPTDGVVSATIEDEYVNTFSTSDSTLIGQWSSSSSAPDYAGERRRIAHSYKTSTGSITFTPSGGFNWRIAALPINASGGSGSNVPLNIIVPTQGIFLTSSYTR